MPAETVDVALIGGTGKLGLALAARFARAGRSVVIGSRDPKRAAQAAAAVRNDGGSEWTVSGMSNHGAAAAARIVVVSVPFDNQATTMGDLAGAINDKVVVSAAVPVRFGAGGPERVTVAEGSAAEQLAVQLPAARVVGALHTVSSSTLAKLDRDIDADILITGDDIAAKLEVADLLTALKGARVVDAGPLRNCGHVEQLTVLLLSINMRVRRNLGVRLTNLPDDRAMSSPP